MQFLCFFFGSSVCLLCAIITYLFHFLFHFRYPLEACLFSNERQKGSGSRQERGWGGAESSKEETVIRVYYVRIESIFNKRKKTLKIPEINIFSVSKRIPLVCKTVLLIKDAKLVDMKANGANKFTIQCLEYPLRKLN